MISAPRIVGPRKLPVRQGSPEWLEARRTHVTATDLPVLLGISPWKCEQDLADEKLSGNGVESTLRMRVGSALEDLILAAYAEQTGRKARRVRGLWESSRVPWAAASPDATAAGRLVELKWTGARARFGSGLPEDVEAQVQWQLFVAESPECDVATLTVGEDDLRVFTVHADDGLQRHLVAIAADFRRRLAEGGPFAQSLDSIKRRHPADDGTEMTADPDLDAAMHALRAVRASVESLEADEKALKVAVQTRMADAAVLVGDGYRVTWRRTKDRTETDWKSLAADLLNEYIAEPERAALVGGHATVQPGFRPWRVTWEKEEAS
jgi:putative phage-type endonuclease